MTTNEEAAQTVWAVSTSPLRHREGNMAAKRKSKQEEEPEEETPRPGNWFTRSLFRPRVLIGLVAAIVMTAAVPMILKRLPDLSNRPEYRLQSADIVITAPPRYVPADLVDEVIEQQKLPTELSLLDDGLVKQIAKSFSRHPWVAEVVSVEKSIPARVTVTLRYRHPVAMVQVQQGLYPVDADGCLLPPADFSVAETKHYPLIRNVQSTPQGAAGTEWGDVTVTAAAQLASTLQADWEAMNLAAIRLPRQTTASPQIADVQLELLTKGGSVILWGRAPGSNHPGELEAKQKIGRLQKYQADFGSFDDSHGPYEIDIRHWQEISRRPLSQRNRSARR